MRDLLYMLDTNICIYITKNRPESVMKHFQSMAHGQIVMSFITYGDLVFGAQKSQYKQQVLAKLERLRQIIPVVHSTDSLSESYGKIRAELEQAGKTIGGNDYWIAAHALSSGYVLVSNNVREFERVDGLLVENWVE